MNDTDKTVTMSYGAYKCISERVSELERYIHDCEVSGKFKVETIYRYLTTTYLSPYDGLSLLLNHGLKVLLLTRNLKVSKHLAQNK